MNVTVVLSVVVGLAVLYAASAQVALIAAGIVAAIGITYAAIRKPRGAVVDDEEDSPPPRRQAAAPEAPVLPPAPTDVQEAETTGFRTVQLPSSLERSDPLYENELDQALLVEQMNRGREADLRHLYKSALNAKQKAAVADTPLRNDPHLRPLDAAATPCRYDVTRLP